MLTLPPLGLYIHIPWCVQKCPYCDFNSHKSPDTIPVSAYIDALEKDMSQQAQYAQGRVIETIFIGGGTPSLFSGAEIGEILAMVQRYVPLADDAEVTMEANPGTVEHDTLQAYVEAGVNRLSLGIQSFEAEKLMHLGRIHNDAQAKVAANEALKAGFNSINLDLMHGLQNQTPEHALNDLKEAIKLNPPHLSWYQLTIEPNTLFHSKPPTLPDDEALWAIYQQGKALLKQHGYIQYEVSAYAKEGYRCRHNLNYWEFGDYLAIGAGAHGKITLADENKIFRFSNIKHPKGYLSNEIKCYQRDEIETEDRAVEYLMNRARLMTPIDIDKACQATGISKQTFEDKLTIAQQKGLVNISSTQWQLTEKGQLFINEILSLFL